MNKNIFVGLLLTLLVSSLQAAPQPLNGIAAIVNNGVILNSEFERGLKRISAQLQEAGQAVDDQQVLRKQVMERLVLRKVQEQKAKELGLRVDDSELNRTLQRIARSNKMGLAQFRQALLAEGVDYREFRSEVREEVLLAQLRKRQVEMQTKVSDQELDDFLSLRQRVLKSDFEYHLRHILIVTGEGDDLALIGKARQKAEKLLAKLKEGADFSALAMRSSDGQYALEGGDLGWRKLEQLPKVFVESLQNAKEGDILGPLRSASGFHLLLLEKSRGEERHFVEQSHARHILLRVTEVRDSETTLAELKAIRERIVAGEDFASVAKAVSDDPGSAVAGGDLGWFAAGVMVPAFEKVVNELAVNEFSEPFRSAFGWHVVQLLGKRTQDDTEEFLREKARERLLERKVEEASEIWLRKLRAQAYVEVRLAGLADVESDQ